MSPFALHLQAGRGPISGAPRKRRGEAYWTPARLALKEKGWMGPNRKIYRSPAARLNKQWGGIGAAVDSKDAVAGRREGSGPQPAAAVGFGDAVEVESIGNRASDVVARHDLPAMYDTYRIKTSGKIN